MKDVHEHAVWNDPLWIEFSSEFSPEKLVVRAYNYNFLIDNTPIGDAGTCEKEGERNEKREDKRKQPEKEEAVNASTKFLFRRNCLGRIRNGCPTRSYSATGKVGE